MLSAKFYIIFWLSRYGESQAFKIACDSGTKILDTDGDDSDDDQGFCGQKFEDDDTVFDQQLKDKNLDVTFLNFPVCATQQFEVLVKESVCIEEKDVDEKECEEVDLERPEKGEIDAEKEFAGEKLGSDDFDVELIFQFDEDELEDRKLMDTCQPPRVPFQTPVKTSPIDILFEFGQNSSNQNGSSMFLMQPEILERKLIRFNLDSSSPTANDENLDEQLHDNCEVSGKQGTGTAMQRFCFK